jgi:hypothetical protein
MNILKKQDKTDLVIYSIYFITLILIAIPTEKADMMCPNSVFTKNKKLCKEGNGKLFRYSKISPKDDIKSVSIKMSKLIDDKQKQVLWRRYFLFSGILSIALHYIITERLPRGKEFMISFLLIYISSLQLHNFYSYHYEKIFDRKIKNGLRKIYSDYNKLTINHNSKSN